MITEAYCQFFQDLEANNNRTWFENHRDLYQETVKKPFMKLTEELIGLLRKEMPDISENPADALFRINRDVRFTKDKSPYHLLMKAAFAPPGEKQTAPAYYLAITADQLIMGGGLVRINTKDLERIRRHIFANPSDFLQLLESPDYIKYYGKLEGVQSKRLHKDFRGIKAKLPYIANKQFYVMQKIPLEPHLQSQILPLSIMRRFKAVFPLNKFLQNALT